MAVPYVKRFFLAFFLLAFASCFNRRMDLLFLDSRILEDPNTPASILNASDLSPGLSCGLFLLMTKRQEHKQTYMEMITTTSVSIGSSQGHNGAKTQNPHRETTR